MITTRFELAEIPSGRSTYQRPEFSEEVWDEWEVQKIEQFGERRKTVAEITEKFEELGIYLMDLTPRNIAFVG